MSISNIQFGDTIALADVRNRLIGASLNILDPKDLNPTAIPIGWFIVYAVFQDDGILSVMRNQKTAGITQEMLNEGDNLLADTAYMFIFPVAQGETINFQYSVPTRCSKMLVLEIIREP